MVIYTLEVKKGQWFDGYRAVLIYRLGHSLLHRLRENSGGRGLVVRLLRWKVWLLGLMKKELRLHIVGQGKINNFG